MFSPDDFPRRKKIGGHIIPGDEKRLCAQGQKVFDVMADSVWRTLGEIRELTGYPEASISARMRDFRKPAFGGHDVFRRHRGPKEQGLYEYRLSVRIARYTPQGLKSEAIQKAAQILGAHEPGPQPEPPGHWLADFDLKCEEERGAT